ncbi:hypothetical protein [Mesorhizobium sp. M0488]|uniref:hypothetical protein n=1 Tax=unclassified Mesorhizobium TaxID=325217 RepID=UPI003334C4F9
MSQPVAEASAPPMQAQPARQSFCRELRHQLKAKAGPDITARNSLGFPASYLYVAIADRAIGFEMPPDIPVNDLKK